MIVPNLAPQAVDVSTVTWRLDRSAVAIETPVAINNPDTNLLLITGYGEKDVAGIAQRLGQRGVSLAVFNVSYPPDVDLTPDVVEQSIINSTVAAVRHVNTQAGRPENTPLIGAGHSRGSADQVRMAYEHPELFSLLIESATFGVTTDSLGDDFKPQRRELKRRMKSAGLLDIQHVDTETATAQVLDAARLFREYTAGIKYGLSQNGAKMVKSLRHRGVMKRLFVGADDPIFQPQEFEEVLGDNGFVVRIPDAAHESLLTESGCDYMAEVIKLGMSDVMLEQVAA